MLTEKNIALNAVKVVVRRYDESEEFLLGYFTFDKDVLESLPRTLKYHGLTGDIDWDDDYITQLYASGGEITFEIVFGGSGE